MITKALQQSLVKLVETKEERDEALSVRHAVMIEELGFDISTLCDEFDEDARNVLYYAVDQDWEGNIIKKPVGALRFFFYNQVVKIGRVAVLEKYRGQQIGKKMMLFAEEEVWNKPEYSHINQIALSAIYDKVPFYNKLGYRATGEVYLEEGYPAILLIKDRP